MQRASASSVFERLVLGSIPSGGAIKLEMEAFQAFFFVVKCLEYRVVNERYKDKLPIIITSNYGVESLSERLDYSAFSRLAAICDVVEMRGIDYRMKDYLC